jgi:hypothetical protein
MQDLTGFHRKLPQLGLDPTFRHPTWMSCFEVLRVYTRQTEGYIQYVTSILKLVTV